MVRGRRTACRRWIWLDNIHLGTKLPFLRHHQAMQRATGWSSARILQEEDLSVQLNHFFFCRSGEISKKKKKRKITAMLNFHVEHYSVQEASLKDCTSMTLFSKFMVPAKRLSRPLSHPIVHKHTHSHTNAAIKGAARPIGTNLRLGIH